MHPWAADKIARAGSYVEVTPSNEGVRIIGLSNGGDPLHCACDDVPGTSGVRCELYRKAERYITITGTRSEKPRGWPTSMRCSMRWMRNSPPVVLSEGRDGRARASTIHASANERALKVENLPKWVKAIFSTAKRRRSRRICFERFSSPIA